MGELVHIGYEIRYQTIELSGEGIHGRGRSGLRCIARPLIRALAGRGGGMEAP